MHRVLIPLILALGMALRMWGLDWGLPDERHPSSYHGGESRAVAIGMQIDPGSGDFTPRWKGGPWFRWGSHSLYAMGAANHLDRALGNNEFEGPWTTWGHRAFARGHWIARFVSVLYSMATVALVGWMAHRTWGRRTALWASAFAAAAPLAAYTAHFATVNACLTFWVTASLWACTRAAERARGRDFFLAGGAVGLAIAAKLTALPLLAPAGIAAILASRHRRFEGQGSALRRASSWIGLGTLGILVGFGLAMPYAYVHLSEFTSQAYRELFHHSQAGHGFVFAASGNGFVHLLGTNLRAGLGILFWILALISIPWALWATLVGARAGHARIGDRGWLLDVMLLAWVIPNLIGLSLVSTRFLRYVLPLVPAFALWGGRFLAQAGGASRRPGLRIAVRAFGGIALLQTLLYSAAYNRTFAGQDPRDQAADWFETWVEPGAHVAFLKRPAHNLPPIRHPWSQLPVRSSDPDVLTVDQDRTWSLLNLDPKVLVETRPDYLVMSVRDLEAEWELLPLVQSEPERFPEELREHVLQAGRFWVLVERGYELATEPFSARPRLLGIDFGWRTPPRGWDAATGEIRIYRRRDSLSGAAPGPGAAPARAPSGASPPESAPGSAPGPSPGAGVEGPGTGGPGDPVEEVEAEAKGDPGGGLQPDED